MICRFRRSSPGGWPRGRISDSAPARVESELLRRPRAGPRKRSQSSGSSNRAPMGKDAMADGWALLSDRVKTLAVDWAAYAALGSFVLYALGYLTLRFHLTALGIG